MALTKEEFAAGYAERSHLTKEQYDRAFTTMACSCYDPECKGWAAVGKGLENIHKDLCQ